GTGWYLLRILPYRTVEDVIDGVVLTFLDIGELKQAQSHATRLARIVESSRDGIIGKSLDGVITSWNAGAERMYGYSAQEAAGRPMDLIVPPERRGELPPVFDKLRQGLQVESFETVRVRRDGRHLDVSVTVSPVYDAGGRLVGASGIDRDVSDRKAAEAALAEAARRKDEFLALLGHELRNPLAPISNCLQLLRDPGLDAGQRDKAHQTAERQLKHLTRLVDDLLDVARISRGKIQLQPARLDLVEAVRTTVEDQRPAIAAAGLDLDLDLPAGPLWLDADPTRLAQAVGNLLHNAGKFTPAGGRIAVALREEPEWGTVCLTVRDTGIGMEPELLARLFEPFSQSARNPVHGRGGLGLGLALVKALAELHGGAVSAASPGPGRGSEIALRLPLQTARQEEAVVSEPQPGEEGVAPRRCLVIEDHTDAAESLALLLELAGHEVAVAFDAASGLEKARSFGPDVVLCDIGLPGAMDGYGVARALRTAAETRSAYLIALTGYGQEDDRRRALEAGFDAHLTKPADLDALHRLLAGAGPR
ncbi:MAG TPA: ATP-binding protein, partial [Thermoanaerobaculia bacterium]|nr:ATP-binding protein [Thermoanaerobaculia bacterium]